MNTNEPQALLVLSRRSARGLDEAATNLLRMPTILLMENAGGAIAAEALRLCAGPAPLEGVLFLCGPGNNGGDGYSAARRLLDGRRRLEVFSFGRRPLPDSDAGLNRAILERAGAPVRACPPASELAALLERPLLVVDALFGTGFSRPLEGEAAAIVEVLNASGRTVLAADLPTGLDADTGEVLGRAVRASTTVTFAAPKRGFYLSAGPSHVGKVVVGDLGLPPRFLAAYLEPA
ncbi:MAG TPA: NAD(P)H-hydrate epimerase [Planctomycetota bacterium]|jgi:NAD(P)H-hydrate epimerase|nr:NAD(P)H-hydrate epimerase [Planctomycetota bacterium]